MTASATDDDHRDETLLKVWARRAVSVPVFFLLAALAVATIPAWAVVTPIVDVLRGSGRTLPRTRALAFFTIYLVCEVIGVAVAGVLWLVLLGGLLSGTRRWIEANAALQRAWTTALWRGAVRVFSLSVVVEGSDEIGAGPLLAFVRHSSTADTVLTAALIANPRRLLLRYVLKLELVWDPCLDIVGRRLPNAFVDRRGTQRQGEVAAIAGLAHGLDAHSGVLIYPEGTRFSADKLKRSIDGLKRKGLAELAVIAGRYTSVLPPRLGGPLALLDAAPAVDVLLVEHTGFEGAASFATFWSGALVHQTVRVRARRIAAASIPTDRRDVWLFSVWEQVDAWVRAHSLTSLAGPTSDRGRPS